MQTKAVQIKCEPSGRLTKETIHMELIRNKGCIRVGNAYLAIRSRNQVVVDDCDGEERVFSSLTAAVDDFYYLT